MAHQKIQAGGTLDVVTKKELHDALGEHLRSWVAETARGGRFVKFQGTANPVGTSVQVGGPTGSGVLLGPGAGFMWDVRRIHLAGFDDTDNVAIYLNDVSPTGFVSSNKDLFQSKNRLWTWNRQLVLYPGDQLIVANTSTLVATGPITISGQALELPVGLGWKLTGG